MNKEKEQEKSYLIQIIYGKGGKVHHWVQINNLTKKFMDENQQDFSFNTLEICIKKYITGEPN